MHRWSRSGYIVDIHKREIFPGTVFVKDGKIDAIEKTATAKTPFYIMPGFIDAHIHIESSMLIPSEFARLAVVHGTVATVSDPHEIGNVLGVEGIRYMIRNGKKVPFHFYFGASSCVPATHFETAGAEISPADVETLFVVDKLKYLSEMMNYPGVLHQDSEVMEKIAIAKRLGLPVDGHAPGMRGEEAKQYIQAGISTDHECFTYDEALDKLNAGMQFVIIREGSAAKNYDALHPLIAEYPARIMFCSDDKHPHELAAGHINQLVARSVTQNHYDLFDVLRIASLHPAQHYDLDVGLLRVGDNADFIVVENLADFSVYETFIDGKLVAKSGKTLIARVKEEAPNHFDTERKLPQDFVVKETGPNIHVIHPDDGQLITHDIVKRARIRNHEDIADPKNDLLKIAVVNRYNNAPPAVAFIENFGLQKGAIASCVEHDSHNIIAVGCTDEELAKAVNAIIDNRGGISAVVGEEVHVLPLPVAGIMSAEDGYAVARKYTEIDAVAKRLGTHLQAPFMTLSFMGLLVIPELKLSDKGLFDGRAFQFVSLDAR